MRYTRFEDLPVWQAAMTLAEGVFALTEDPAWNRKGDLRNQLQRAALSISNNIAEGFERGTTQELITFLYIARGSAGEVRSMLIFAERLAALTHLKSQISNLKSQSEGTARQLRAWAESLQGSSIRGQRYLTEEAKREEEQKRKETEFRKQLRQITETAAKDRERQAPKPSQIPPKAERPAGEADGPVTGEAKSSSLPDAPYP